MLSVATSLCRKATSMWRKPSRRGGFLERNRLRYAEPLEFRHMLTAPVAVDDQYTTQEDTLLFLVTPANGVLVNDTDADQDPLKAVVVDGPAHGQLVLNANGGFVYDMDDDFFGVDTFTYRAEDSEPSNVATVTLNVTPVYDAPRPANDTYKFRPGDAIQVAAPEGVLANDANPDQANLTVTLVDDVASGTLTLQADGSFNYDPLGFTGVASFTYAVDDGRGPSAPVNVDIAITTPPVANADAYETDEDTVLSVAANGGLLSNDVDAESTPLTATLVTGPDHGTLTLESDGSFVYEPEADYYGPDGFTYFTSDGFDDSATVDVSLSVTSVNDVPASVEDAYFTLPGQTLVIGAATGLLSNDSDIELSSLSASLATGPAHGQVVVQPDGAFQYVPTTGFQGEDSFTYIASDGVAVSAPTSVFVAVDPHPFVISEFMAENLDTIQTRVRDTPEGRFSGLRQMYDWIEIENVLARSFDIGGLHLTDNADDPNKWTFPSPTIVPAGGSVVVFASGLDISDPVLDENGFVHTNFKLDSDGEYLAITAQDGSILHDYAPQYPRQLPNVSYGLTADGAAYQLTPTLGQPNSGETAIGMAAAPMIEIPHGFFTAPVEVTIQRPDAETSVRYTLDGSTPSPDNGIDYLGPITIDRTTVVRAAGFKPGYLTSRVDTRSYIFLNDVLTQSADGQPPEGWPDRWGSNSTDYGMDPDIVDSPEWGPQMIDALTQIPSMSVVTDLPNLFDSRNGIYARPASDGFAAERPASLELINPDGTVGFQHNIGIRIRGGFSRATSNPKHAFRIFFDSVYGDGSLNYPLFEDEGAEQLCEGRSADDSELFMGVSKRRAQRVSA